MLFESLTVIRSKPSFFRSLLPQFQLLFRNDGRFFRLSASGYSGFIFTDNQTGLPHSTWGLKDIPVAPQGLRDVEPFMWQGARYLARLYDPLEEIIGV